MNEGVEEKRESGGQPGNRNALKTLPIDLKDYDLNKVSDCFRLLQANIQATYEGKISARACGSVNNAIRIILTYHSDINQVAENKALIEESKRRIHELEEKLDELQRPQEALPQ
jgi:hypothetical protein